MKTLELDHLLNSHKKDILQLWNREYPTKLAHKNLEAFENYLLQLKEQKHRLILDKTDKVVAWYFDFIRADEKWFAIIIDQNLQAKGIGSKLLNLAKQKESVLYAWVTDHNKYFKSNGHRYISPLPFYLNNGFTILNDERLELKHLSAVKIKWVKS